MPTVVTEPPSPDPVLFAPPDFDLMLPPGYPETLVVFTHARWRIDPLDEQSALGPRWATPADFQRWQNNLPDVPEGSGEGTVGTRGVRTAHVILRSGRPPVVGWSCYRKIFGEMEAPVRLSAIQQEAVEHFLVLRSVDCVILAHREMSREEAIRVRRLVLIGVPPTAANEPEHKQARKFHALVREKLTFNGWGLEIRDSVPNRNPAAFLSHCYRAPLVVSPTPRAGTWRMPVGSVGDQGSGGEESQLLQEFTTATQMRDTRRMAELFAGLIQHVQQVGSAHLQAHDNAAGTAAAEIGVDETEAETSADEFFPGEEKDVRPGTRRGRGR